MTVPCDDKHVFVSSFSPVVLVLLCANSLLELLLLTTWAVTLPNGVVNIGR